MRKALGHLRSHGPTPVFIKRYRAGAQKAIDHETSTSLQPYLPIRPTPIRHRTAMRHLGSGSSAAEREDEIARRHARGPHGGRPPAFDPDVHAGRNVVERCFNRLKQFRDLATRYAKRACGCRELCYPP